MLWSEKYFGSKLYLGYLLITLMTCVILFSGCTLENTSQQTKEEAFFKDLKKNQEETYVYNPYVYELCIYNPTENSYTSCFGENDMLEYCFGLTAENNFVSVGVEETFYVFEISENKMEKMYMQENGYIVPFATDGSNFYYILKQINGEHSIVLLNGNQTEQVVDLGEKEVEGGILHNNCLYYSCYRSDSDLYDIYEYDISSKVLFSTLNDASFFTLNSVITA